jgi:hypothetical protein
VDLWTGDIHFVTTKLDELNRSAPDFKGRLDLSRVGFMGHSLGGAAAMEAGRDDARCVAVANLDGDPYGRVVAEGLQKPLLFVGHEGALAELPATAEKLGQVTRNITSGDAFVLSIKGTRHFNFSNRSLIASRFGLGRWFGFLGPIDGRRGLAVTAALLRRFLDTYVGGEGAFSPAELAREYPEVQSDRLDRAAVTQTAP